MASRLKPTKKKGAESSDTPEFMRQRQGIIQKKLEADLKAQQEEDNKPEFMKKLRSIKHKAQNKPKKDPDEGPSIEELDDGTDIPPWHRPGAPTKPDWVEELIRLAVIKESQGGGEDEDSDEEAPNAFAQAAKALRKKRGTRPSIKRRRSSSKAKALATPSINTDTGKQEDITEEIIEYEEEYEEYEEEEFEEYEEEEFEYEDETEYDSEGYEILEYEEECYEDFEYDEEYICPSSEEEEEVLDESYNDEEIEEILSDDENELIEVVEGDADDLIVEDEEDEEVVEDDADELMVEDAGEVEVLDESYNEEELLDGSDEEILDESYIEYDDDEIEEEVYDDQSVEEEEEYEDEELNESYNEEEIIDEISGEEPLLDAGESQSGADTSAIQQQMSTMTVAKATNKSTDKEESKGSEKEQPQWKSKLKRVSSKRKSNKSTSSASEKDKQQPSWKAKLKKTAKPTLDSTKADEPPAAGGSHVEPPWKSKLKKAPKAAAPVTKSEQLSTSGGGDGKKGQQPWSAKLKKSAGQTSKVIGKSMEDAEIPDKSFIGKGSGGKQQPWRAQLKKAPNTSSEASEEPPSKQDGKLGRAENADIQKKSRSFSPATATRNDEMSTKPHVPPAQAPGKPVEQNDKPEWMKNAALKNRSVSPVVPKSDKSTGGTADQEGTNKAPWLGQVKKRTPRSLSPVATKNGQSTNSQEPPRQGTGKPDGQDKKPDWMKNTALKTRSVSPVGPKSDISTGGTADQEQTSKAPWLGQVKKRTPRSLSPVATKNDESTNSPELPLQGMEKPNGEDKRPDWMKNAALKNRSVSPVVPKSEKSIGGTADQEGTNKAPWLGQVKLKSASNKGQGG